VVVSIQVSFNLTAPLLSWSGGARFLATRVPDRNSFTSTHRGKAFHRLLTGILKDVFPASMRRTGELRWLSLNRLRDLAQDFHQDSNRWRDSLARQNCFLLRDRKAIQ
jgi:hypothetical protein